MMRIFLDTANIEQIREGARLGVVSGVTTNPTLVSKEANADYQAVCIYRGRCSVSTEAVCTPQFLAVFCIVSDYPRFAAGYNLVFIFDFDNYG